MTKPAMWLAAFPNQRRTRPAKARQRVALGRSWPRGYKRTIRKVSPRQRQRLAQYRPIADAWLSKPENRRCAVCGQPSRGGNPINVHHMRGRMGALLCDTRFFRAVHDYGCHQWIEANKPEARRRGLLCDLGDWGRAA